MLLDSNSRSILGCCVVAVALLLTWFHGNGNGLDRARSRCEPKALQVGEASDCAACHQDEKSRRAASTVDDAGQTPARIVTAAPRS